MPSPIAHLTAGYAVYVLARSYAPKLELSRVGPLPGLLLLTGGFSLLPDLDTVAGILMGDFGRFHNNATHSLVVGLALACAFGVLMHWRQGSGFGRWFGIALLCYELHVLMDWTTIGRGVMAWWPLTGSRFQAPVFLFYGLHWSQGWWSPRHLWTLATELAFAVGTLLALRRFIRGSHRATG